MSPSQRTGHWYLRFRQLRNYAYQLPRRMSRPNPTAYVAPSASVAPETNLGDYAFIGPRCRISPGVSIGDFTMLAAEVAVVGGDHVTDRVGVPAQFAGRPSLRATTIGSDVWLGRPVIVMTGLRVGDAALVAAGSVVTKDIPDGEVWAGVPARRVRYRFGSEDLLNQHLAGLKAGKFEVALVTNERT